MTKIGVLLTKSARSILLFSVITLFVNKHGTVAFITERDNILIDSVDENDTTLSNSSLGVYTVVNSKSVSEGLLASRPTAESADENTAQPPDMLKSRTALAFTDLKGRDPASDTSEYEKKKQHSENQARNATPGNDMMTQRSRTLEKNFHNIMTKQAIFPNIRKRMPSQPAFGQCPVENPKLQIWRKSPSDLKVLLTTEHVCCILGANCTSLKTGSDVIYGDVIEMNLQNGDWLKLKFLEGKEACTDGHGGVQVVLYNITGKSAMGCYEAHEISQIIAEWKTKLLDEYIVKSELLDPGIQLFDVTLKSYDSQTTLVWRLNLTIQPQDCAEKSGVTLCSGKGICVSDETKRSFSCKCCPNFGGNYCELSDGCHGNPCKNGGLCLDTKDGIKSEDYRCLCPHGYSGRLCEDKINLCDHQPCLHNATCRENETVYWCQCPAGFTGHNCESKINECLANPCVHGVCENGEKSFTCYCLPGFGGDHCEFEYDECDSNPCINGGACEDLVAGYKCHCGPGYEGKRCQIKVNLCNPNPCPSPARCVDRGSNYSCVCNSLYNGAGCTQHYNPCFPNPCQNSGSCWPSLDTYFCSCRPGYTGNLCEVQVLYSSKSLGRTLEDAAGFKRDDSLVDSVNVPLDHLHNIYIAAATLAGACLIVVFVVTVCHCRVHKTYQRLFSGSLHGDMCSDAKHLRREDPDRFLLSLRGSVSNLRPCPDGVYEATTIDLSENLDRPLIDS